jgi:hypothetical protein
MKVERLSLQAITLAQAARDVGAVDIAAEISAAGLGLPNSPLSTEELAQIADDPNQLSILACLARIHVDSLKTAANQTMWPPRVLHLLEQAVGTIETIYRHPQLSLAIRELTKDPWTQKHHFWPEMRRDEAKTLFAASYLYSGLKARVLVLSGETTLLRAYHKLDDQHPTKPLIGIEHQLSLASRRLQPDLNALKEDFNRLMESDLKSNPHRVATVASWFVAWGKKLNDREMEDMGTQVFEQIIAIHPEWAFMAEAAHKKIAQEQLRRTAFRVLTPLTISPQKRGDFYSRLVSF